MTRSELEQNLNELTKEHLIQLLLEQWDRLEILLHKIEFEKAMMIQ